MKLFEIIFILLLLIPVALLMRYFITRLSAEVPKQGRPHPDMERKPSILRWWRERKSRQAEPPEEENIEASVEEAQVRESAPRQPEKASEPKRSSGSGKNAASGKNSKRGSSPESGKSSKRKSSRESEKASKGRSSAESGRSSKKGNPADSGRSSGSKKKPAQGRKKRSTPYQDIDAQKREAYIEFQEQRRRELMQKREQMVRQDEALMERDVRTSGYQADGSGVINRNRTALKRTERIPFTELYTAAEMEKARNAPPPAKRKGAGDTGSAGSALAERRAAAKSRPRSETEPTKRQKRNNRKKSRKRRKQREDKSR